MVNRRDRLPFELAFPLSTFCQKASIQDVNVKGMNGVWKVSFNVEGCFTEKMEEAIQSGIPTAFTFYINLYQKRRWWKDRKMASLEFHHTVQYHPIQKVYQVTLGENHSSLAVSSLEEAKKLMSKVKEFEVRYSSPLKPRVPAYFRIKAELDPVRLPLHLEYLFFFVSLWDFETDWHLEPLPHYKKIPLAPLRKEMRGLGKREKITMKKTLSPDARRRRNELIIIGIISILILIFTTIEMKFPQIEGKIPVANNIIIFSLININIILILLLIFLVIRNLVKLIFERKRKVLGARLRTKLVVAFVSLSLVPTILLFLVAVGFITNSVEHWFSAQVEQSLQGSLEVAQTYYRDFANDAVSAAQQVSKSLSEQGIHKGSKEMFVEGTAGGQTKGILISVPSGYF